MSGKVLILDPVATNRIVLKVKLSATFYEVSLAQSSKEALALVAADAPDLVLVSGQLDDMPLPGVLNALKNRAKGDPPMVVFLLRADATDTRLALLRAGADDVLDTPGSDTVLLARLRNLLQQRNAAWDMHLRADTAAALGFADTPARFDHPGRVAVLVDDPARSVKLCRDLARLTGHRCISLECRAPRGVLDLSFSPDVILMEMSGEVGETGLHLMAELRTNPKTRRARILARVNTASHPDLIAIALDMGANDATAEDTDIAELALRLSRQIDHKRADDRLRDSMKTGLRAAVIDPLTGLHNRRYALAHLKRQITSATRENRNLAVMVADLDFFKSVNDSHGHAAGDMVLARVAALLRAAGGPDDLIARIGGEEFLISIPGASRTQARQTASQLCRQVRETPIQVPGRTAPVHVTISIGVTLFEPGGDGYHTSIESLLAQADRALYGSKACGRNTVTFDTRSAA